VCVNAAALNRNSSSDHSVREEVGGSRDCRGQESHDVKPTENGRLFVQADLLALNKGCETWEISLHRILQDMTKSGFTHDTI
jgi:hypothetical protein